MDRLRGRLGERIRLGDLSMTKENRPMQDEPKNPEGLLTILWAAIIAMLTV